MPLFGAIEAGGTKFNCMVASGPEEIKAEIRIPTTTPEQTLQAVIEFFKSNGPLDAIGIGSFGPLDLDPSSQTYGFITATPKPGWSYANLVGPIRQRLCSKVALDTDVNAAAIGEGMWGAAKGLNTALYITIGTGVGGGAISAGIPIHGLVHPEMGHIGLPHDLQADPFPGNCPFHGDCFEGMTSGPAIQKRWGVSADQLPADHPAWDIEATYIAMALQSLILTLSPQKVILGGGVMQQPQLFPLIRAKVVQRLNGYIQSDTILKHIDGYIVPPGLGTRSGLFGALALAIRA
jgi:fructokinase